MRQYRGDISAERCGFTLLELMLVLVLIVTIGAVAWPSLRRGYESVYLKKAAEQVQAAFTKARVQAISAGLPNVFRFEPETGQYTISTWQDESAPLESNSTSNSGASSSSSATGTLTAGAERQLPTGIVFVGAERASNTRSDAAEGELASLGQPAGVPPVLFFPDGTTSEVTITIRNQNGRCISVYLRGLTGIARVGDLFTKDQATY